MDSIKRFRWKIKDCDMQAGLSAFLSQTSWPVGEPVEHFEPPIRPVKAPLVGRYGRWEPLTTAHAEDLWRAFSVDREGRSFTYLPYGPFNNSAQIKAFISARESIDDPVFYAWLNPEGQAIGFGSFLRIDPLQGCIEIGHLGFSPALQGTTMATECIYLLSDWAFKQGYRRLEWKCDALNRASRRAAERFGFMYEGVFRQATIVKGRNRDTAWYAIIDRDWPTLRHAYEAWLHPDNFAEDGGQRRRLADLRAIRLP
jgi:RimJ/RimL family protein N-acetyltransferase